MATIQAKVNPGSRMEAGAAVLAAAEAVDTAPVKARLGRFVAAHKAYVAAEAGVQKAQAALVKQQAVVAERDVDQDEAVEALAVALANDGLPRTSPFSPFGLPSVSTIQKLAYADETKAVRKLLSAVRKRKGTSKETLSRAAALEKATAQVESALAVLPGLEQAVTAARARRETLALPWEKTFAALKRGARAAEDDGADGLFEALFQRNAPAAPSKAAVARKKAARAEKKTQGEGTASGATGSGATQGTASGSASGGNSSGGTTGGTSAPGRGGGAA